MTAFTTLAATTSNPTMWYVTRAAATSSYVTLTGTVGLGLLRSLARSERRPNATYLWLLDESHQFLALLTAAFLALHLISLLFDSYLPFSVVNLLVPLNEPYKEIPIALGVLALYAMAAVLASSWLRRKISYTLWRNVHYVSFVVFALVTAHGLLAGSDSSQPWASAMYFGASAFIGVLTVVRIFASPRAQVARR
ncbi:MAG TPA: ferric reductase-like transmembrane domain-containing protein [Ktedonobacterales bacterium]|nr:ferric reductase-like transmembrane domain-containing protein [Ktedonobacterales bacterium]